jgi:hypothetical protein
MFLGGVLIVMSLVMLFTTPSASAEAEPKPYNFYFSQGGSYYNEKGGAGSNKLAEPSPWEPSFYLETGLSYRAFGWSYRFFNERSVAGGGDAPNAVHHHYFRGAYVLHRSTRVVLAVKGGVVVDRFRSYVYQDPSETEAKLYFEPVLSLTGYYLPSGFYAVGSEIGALRRVKPLPDWVPEGSDFYRSYSGYVRVKNSVVVLPFLTLDVTPNFTYDGPSEPLSPTARREEYPTCVCYGIDFGFSLYPLAIGRD